MSQTKFSFSLSMQSAWERRLVKCVNSMAAELGVPLARRRTKQEREEFSDRWADLSTEETGGKPYTVLRHKITIKILF